MALPGEIREQYDQLRKTKQRKGICDPDVGDALQTLVNSSLDHLKSKEISQQNITSHVPGKQYIEFESNNGVKPSRPINASLLDVEAGLSLAGKLISGNRNDLAESSREAALYTIAMSYCCMADIYKRSDQGSPGYFVQCLAGHILCRLLNGSPGIQQEVINPEFQSGLPLDNILDLGSERAILHIPVKISSRERASQAWAHQRMLDGAYGVNRIKGVFVLVSETNRAQDGGKTVIKETCVPEQWRKYQMFIAQLHRVYYFDPPVLYLRLADEYPYLQVRKFANVFDEVDVLASPRTLA